MSLHSVLLKIVTQSLTIGECTDYFGSRDSDNRNDPGRVCMLMYGPACLCTCQHASVHSCSAGPCPPGFFGKIHRYKIAI